MIKRGPQALLVFKSSENTASLNLFVCHVYTHGLALPQHQNYCPRL